MEKENEWRPDKLSTLCMTAETYPISLLHWNEWGLKEVITHHLINKNCNKARTKQNLRPKKNLSLCRPKHNLYTQYQSLNKKLATFPDS